VEAHLDANYKFQKSGDGGFKLVFGLDGGRDQLVFVSRAGNETAGQWATITSPVGDFSAIGSALPDLLRECENNICGALVASSGVVLLRHSMKLAGFDAEAFDWALHAVCQTADGLERRFTGDNKY
jgi:hypothetical protein